MFKDHPWEGEVFGGVEVAWYLHAHYMVNTEFAIDYEPFIKFCKAEGVGANALLMKIAHRLSVKHLPQYVVARNNKFFPSDYATGFVRTITPGRDMVEWVGITEKESRFKEILTRDRMPDLAYYLAARWPRLAFWIARKLMPRHEVKGRFTLLVTRNPMKKLGRPVVFHGTNYPCFFLLIPFGFKVNTVFGYPHAYGNMDRYVDFVKEFIDAIEKPETIERELVGKEYVAMPARTPEDAEAVRKAAPKRPSKELRDKYN